MKTENRGFAVSAEHGEGGLVAIDDAGGIEQDVGVRGIVEEDAVAVFVFAALGLIARNDKEATVRAEVNAL